MINTHSLLIFVNAKLQNIEVKCPQDIDRIQLHIIFQMTQEFVWQYVKLFSLQPLERKPQMIELIYWIKNDARMFSALSHGLTQSIQASQKPVASRIFDQKPKAESQLYTICG